MHKPVTWDGGYVKTEYLVHLPGECVVCWPNAGLMNAMDGSGRIWRPDGKLHVSRVDGREVLDERESDSEPWPADSPPFPAARTVETWADLHLQERRRLKRARAKAKKRRRSK